MKLLESVKLIGLIAWIEYSQQKFTSCAFLGIISVVFILRDWGQNYLFIFSCIIRKQKKKIKPMF